MWHTMFHHIVLLYHCVKCFKQIDGSNKKNAAL